MASTDYLNDLRFCPDCGQPTSSSFRTWGNTICHSTSPKLKCKPLKAHNFCGRCGAANPGYNCAGCRSPEYQWTQLSDSERWFWTNFSWADIPLIVVCCIIVSGGLVWLQFDTLKQSPFYLRFLWAPLLAAGVATYGLIRSLIRLSWAAVDESGSISPERGAIESLNAESLPIARAVGTNAPRQPLQPCPDCGHSVSKRAFRCPQCGCELQSI